MTLKNFVIASIIGILLLTVIVLPVTGGVEPSPFKGEIKKLSNVENKLESYHSRLIQITSSFPEENEVVKNSLIGKFWRTWRDINKLTAQTENILIDISIEQTPLPSEIQLVLNNIKADAKEIINIVTPYLSLTNNSDLLIAMKQVINSAQDMVYLVDSYLRVV